MPVTRVRTGWRIASATLKWYPHSRTETFFSGARALRVRAVGSDTTFLPSPCSFSCSKHSFTRSTGSVRSASSRAAEVTGGIAVVRQKGKDSAYCYGCGADLVKASTSEDASSDVVVQTITKKKGFWADKKDELKKSKLKNWALCPRCKKLQKAYDAAADLVDLGPNSKMTEVFRQEVSRIRTKEKAVVIYCVDAINISGSLIKTIRNYVGGNPVLLAVTRCDLLPDYVWKRHDESIKSLKTVFRRLAGEIVPAEIYLCSEDPEYRRRTGGIQELTDDLWDHLNGRDPYVIGSANIGKSTLTDILVAKLASRGEKNGQFSDRLGSKRLNTLRTSRITKSSLPGTTLQNVRVPCFEDHTQALWDTPGLLLDESYKHFPIRNLLAIRAKRPSQIQPQVIVTDKKAFCLLISEKGDPLPLMRIEIRLKKNAECDGPVRLVWNSTLPLETKIVDIATAMEEEHRRSEKIAAEIEFEKFERQKTQQDLAGLSKEDRLQRKQQRKEEHDRRIAKEKEDLGPQAWRKLQAERKAASDEKSRTRKLSRLREVHQFVLEGCVGVDLAVANFGWLGVLMPATALIKSFAPSTGVRVTPHPTMGLPTEFGDYSLENLKDDSKSDGISEQSDSDLEPDVESDLDSDVDEDYLDDWGGGGGGDWGYDDMSTWDNDYNDYDHDPLDQPDRFGFDRNADEKFEDKWAKYSGKNVGWQWDKDGRFLREGLEEGWNPLREKKDG